MTSRKNLPLVTLIVIILALVPTLVLTRPAEAKVDLHAGKGEANWFFRSCTPARPGAATAWGVEANPSTPSRTSLNFQVKNAYPGYQLHCELYFANTGKLPLWVKEITVYNPNARDLLLSAAVAAGEQKKILQPCGSRPNWGKNPALLPYKCWSKIKLSLTIGPNVKENSRLDFAVRVRLEEKALHH